MNIDKLIALALAALSLGACSSTSSSNTSTAADTSPAATSSDDNGDLPLYVATFQKMEAGIDNHFSDVLTNKKVDGMPAASVGYHPEYPCMIGTKADKTVYGVCVLGVGSSRELADADYEDEKLIIAKADPTLAAGAARLYLAPHSIAQAAYLNATHAVYIFEFKSGPKYFVETAFAKPGAMK